ncbi:DUF1360 domain-containing protein [Salinithrix halophila]|uniref:DUF1360 domain-containing protein n=1 Tax=Salinithrix halophila TaxID=1485204 RepID=A0ABV8JEU6_9BACL
MTWLELFVLILASYRLTHLLVYDTITSGLRSLFIDVEYVRDSSDELVKSFTFKGEGWRKRAGMIVSCHWCAGIWSSAVIIGLYSFFPGTFVIWLILAVAGAAAVMEDWMSE